MKQAFAAAVSALLLAGSARAAAPGAEPGPSHVITQPDWLQRPNGEDLSRLYPLLAASLAVEGSATITCTVTALGTLAGCSVTEERPEDIGFGSAALRMAPLFRMRPMTRDGRPVDGGTMRVPILFRLPVGMEGNSLAANTPSQTPSSSSIEFGRRLADATGAVEALTTYYDQMALAVERNSDPAIPDMTRTTVADAYRRIARAHAADFREVYARAYARTFSPDELAQIVTFETTPAGQLLRSNLNDRAAATTLVHNLMRNVRYLAREEFCKRWDCDLPQSAVNAPSGDAFEDPHWSREPEPSRIRQSQPPLVAFLGLRGFARLRCRATDLGSLEGCEVAADVPAGLGYGAAALSLAPAYRLDPALVSKGATVAVRINFTPADQPESATVQRGRNEGALALARRAMGGDGQTTDYRRRFAEELQAVVRVLPRSVSPAAFDALKAAFAVAVENATDSFVEERASLIAAKLSDQEIAQSVAFTESPAGRAWWQRAIQLQRNVNEEGSRVRSQIADEVRAAFCREHDCLY